LRILLVVNSFASSVTARNTVVVQRRLSQGNDVEVVETNRRGHATRFAHDAARRGIDVVVGFGGDGTLNEVANGLAGTDVPVSVLPGGSTNVVARTLGIPNDVVDATEHLLSLADDFQPRRVDLGIANGRRFVFACGAGLDATAARQVDSHPRLKARGGRWYYTWAAVSGFYGSYLRNPVRMRMRADGTTAEGVTAIAQNSDPFTYFGSQPLRVCENAALDNGTLSIAMLRRAAQRDVPTIATRVLVKRLRTPRHRQIDHLDGVTDCRIESVSRDAEGRIKPFPVQVDGDYIGDHGELELGIEPAALSVVA
jgi:diacylglycerol kinase family enzyme